MKPRAIHVVSALLVGLGLGVFIYRFAILGVFWQGSAKWVFPAVGAGLIAAGVKIRSLDGDGEKTPVIASIAMAILGVAGAMGILFALVPTLERASLERRALPGFSFAAPTAKPDVEVLDYNTGVVTWKNIGGANAVMSISWQVGPTSKEDLEVGARALADKVGNGGVPVHTTMTGPDNTNVETIKIDTDKGAPLRMSALTCGSRGVILMSIGAEGIETLHARMLKTFLCTPDPAKETNEPGVVRVAIDLPGWLTSEKAIGHVALTDPEGKIYVLMRELSADETKVGELITPLLNAFGGKITTSMQIGDRVPFSGTIEGEQVEGWARRIPCPTHAILVLAMASTKADAEAGYVATSNAGCLRPGEKPPVWADPPVPPVPADEPAPEPK
ncbi:MAG: hypothetical protein ACKV2T_13185 [Kofleriaceae bacterium]